MTSKARGRVKSLVAFGIAGLLLVAFMAPAVANNGNGQSNNGNQASVFSSNNDCQDAGDTDLTAVFVNESVIGESIDSGDHDCDMAIYFDDNAPSNSVVRDTTVAQTTDTHMRSVFGVRNDGGNVRIIDSVFTSIEVSNQYVPIQFAEGAKGRIAGNEISGNHRAGIVVRGHGTSADVRNNEVTGSGQIGPSSGWAENGIQVSYGATATVMNNVVSAHWWLGTDASSGILVFESDNVVVQGNALHGNEASIGIESWGGFGNQDATSVDGNHVVNNDISVGAGGSDGVSIIAFSLLGDASAENNRVVNNRITGDVGNPIGAPYAGVFVGAYDLSEGKFDVVVDNNKVIRNQISGFSDDVEIVGDETAKVQANVSPVD